MSVVWKGGTELVLGGSGSEVGAAAEPGGQWHDWSSAERELRPPEEWGSG